MFNSKSLIIAFVLGLMGCTSETIQNDAPANNFLRLPGALQSLSTCAGAESLEQLEVRTAISGGILDPRSLGLEEQKDGTIVAKANFELDGVTQKRTETFAIGIYGRMTDADEWVQLATLEEDIALKPNQENNPKLEAFFSDGCGANYDAKTGTLDNTQTDAACDLKADLNRNNRSNLDDFCAGALPSAPSPFLNISPSSIQFQSDIQLGSFSRHVLLIENLSEESITLSADVIGMPGLTIARLDPESPSDVTARRSLQHSEDEPFVLAPLSDTLVTVSYAPVNEYLATGHLQIGATNSIEVTQAFDISVIGNTNGELQPPLSDYDPDQTASTLAEQLGLPLTPFPESYLFSGLPQPAQDIEVQAGQTLEGFTFDTAYYFTVPAAYRFSLSLTGLATDVDMGLFLFDDAYEITQSFLSQNTGESSESIEWRNTTGEAVHAVLALSKVTANRSEADNADALTVFQGLESDLLSTADASSDSNENNAYSLTAHLFSGPEFTEALPMSPTTGAYEGGSTITLYGSGFQEGAEVYVGGIKAFDVQIIDGTKVRFTLPALTGGAQTSPVTVVLVNPSASDGFPEGDGQACTLPESFTYLPPKPTLNTVSPNSMSTSGGAPLTLSGSFFSNTHGSPVVCLNETRVNNVVYANSTQVSVNSPVWSGLDPGTSIQAALKIRNWLSASETLANAPTDAALCDTNTLEGVSEFSNQVAVTISEPEADSPAPAITTLSPQTGSIDGGTDVVITGTDFRDGALVYFGTQLGGSAVRLSDTQIQVQTPATSEAGNTDVVVMNIDDSQTSNALTFAYEIPAPQILSVLPRNATTATTNIIAIEGSGFRANSSGSFPQVIFADGTNTYTAVGVQWLSGSRVLATTPESMAVGTYQVTLQNEDGQMAEGGDVQVIHLQDPVGPAPMLLAISPSEGAVTGGGTVTISAAHLDPSTGFLVLVNNGAVDSNDIVADEDELNLSMPASDSVGTISIRVINPDGQSDTIAYTYVTAGPSVSAINQTEWVTGDNGSLSVDFAHVHEGAHISIRPDILDQVTIVPNADGTYNLTQAAPCPTAGPYVVELVNPDYQSAVVAYYCHTPEVIALTTSSPRLAVNAPLRSEALTLMGSGVGDLVSNNPDLQAKIAVANSDSAVALTTVRNRTQAAVYFELDATHTPWSPYRFVRSDHADFHYDPDQDHALPLSLTSGAVSGDLVRANEEGSQTATGYFYVMQIVATAAGNNGDETGFLWHAFFSTTDIANTISAISLIEASNFYSCNTITSFDSRGVDASEGTYEVDATYNKELRYGDFEGIESCTGTMANNDFSCAVTLSPLTCSNADGDTISNVDVTTLTPITLQADNPFEAILSADSNVGDFASIQFGELSFVSTAGTAVELDETVTLSLTLKGSEEDNTTALAMTYLMGHETLIDDYRLFFDAYNYEWHHFFSLSSYDIGDTMCSLAPVEDAYTVETVTIQNTDDAVRDGVYVRTTNVDGLNGDFYIDGDGTYIYVAKDADVPSPYRSYFKGGEGSLLFFDVQQGGWRYIDETSTGDVGLDSHYWETGEFTTFAPETGHAGFTSAGDLSTGLYPTSESPELGLYGSIIYDFESIPADHSTGDLSFGVSFETDAEVNAFRLDLSDSVITEFPDIGGFCFKPRNQASCDSNSCENRTKVHYIDVENRTILIAPGGAQ